MSRFVERALDLLGKAYLKLARPLGREARARAWVQLPFIQSPDRVAAPTGRALVIAPHPDDESIGCAGTLLLNEDRGREVEIALLTGADYRFDEEGSERGAEMRKCAAILGVETVHCLPGNDQKLAEQPELTGDLRRLIERLRPRIVFVPFFMDAHIDHRAANDLFLAAAKGTLPDNTPVWAYEVWSNCPANVAVDISAVAATKASAISAHLSQEARMSYAESILGLNRYRALQINWRGDPTLTHAEAFVRLPFSEYRALAEPWLHRAGAGGAARIRN